MRPKSGWLPYLSCMRAAKENTLDALPPIYQFPYGTDRWTDGRMQPAKREKRFQEGFIDPSLHHVLVYLLELFSSFTGSTNWKLIYARVHTRFVRFRVDLLIF